MFIVDPTGRILDAKIKLAISPKIEKGELKVIHGIIVHQTGSPTASSTLNGYKTANPNGAHFLLDKDGTVYQTASLFKKTHHVGHIKSRCLAQHSCSPVELRALRGKRVGAQIGRVEKEKPFPQRYPTNEDSIGVEIVSMTVNGVYENPSPQQQASLGWLIGELKQTLKVAGEHVYRHPDVSWKLESEGAGAKW